METLEYDFLGVQDIDNTKRKSFIVQSFNVKKKDLTSGNTWLRYFQSLLYSNESYEITDFRTYFYNSIQEYITNIDKRITKYEIREESLGIAPNQRTYTLLYFKPDGTNWTDDNGIYDNPLFAIPDYYWDKGKWIPHISLAKINETINDSIYKKTIEITQDINSPENNIKIANARAEINQFVNYKKIIVDMYPELIKDVSFE